MTIPEPNLQLLIHFYVSEEHLFRTVTMCPENDRERLLDEVVSSRAWFGGRFARENRRDYMQTRERVERLMFEEFTRKYGRPPSAHPVFFYLRPHLDLRQVNRSLEERAALGEPETRYLVLDLAALADTRHVSFTLFDSHRSFRARVHAGDRPERDGDRTPADVGSLFHIAEVREVYERNRAVEGLHFEVQVWDRRVIQESSWTTF